MRSPLHLLVALTSIAVADGAQADDDGWLSLFAETGVAATNHKGDGVMEEATGVPVGLGLRAVQPLSLLAVQAEARATYNFGLQEEMEHDQGFVFGRVGVGPRFGSGSITVGVAFDSALREAVLPVVSWTILDRPGGSARYREMFFGLTDRGLAAGGTLEFAGSGRTFGIGVQFFGGGKDTDLDGGGGFLATLSVGRGRAAGPLDR